jgi:two-component system, NtrC family, sensor kinase
MERRLFLILTIIIASFSILAAGFSYLIYSSIANPLDKFFYGIDELSRGVSMKRLDMGENMEEFNELALSFNDMAEKLKNREESLALSNQKLSNLNKSYLDLISFVSHELKGILSSAMLNVYSVKDGFLGLTNFKQKRALDSVAKNLEYLSGTVRNFLNLSRIEKGEFDLNKREFLLKEDLVDEAVETFLKQALERQIKLNNRVGENIKLVADLDHIKVALNNLISNAVKYGIKEGEINIGSKDSESEVFIEVYNDGQPLEREELKKLFKKFSRVINSDTKKKKGTGLGLFITAQIIKNHGGRIWADPRERGNAFIFSIPKEGDQR